MPRTWEQNLGLPLTPREAEILTLIIQGKTSKDIACELDLSFKTVETHRRMIHHKFGVHSVAALFHKIVGEPAITVTPRLDTLEVLEHRIIGRIVRVEGKINFLITRLLADAQT